MSSEPSQTFSDPILHDAFIHTLWGHHSFDLLVKRGSKRITPPQINVVKLGVPPKITASPTNAATGSR